MVVVFELELVLLSVAVVVDDELFVVVFVEAAATAAAAAATNEDDDIVRDDGRNEPDEDEFPKPLDKPEDNVDNFECLLLLEDDELETGGTASLELLARPLN